MCVYVCVCVRERGERECGCVRDGRGVCVCERDVCVCV